MDVYEAEAKDLEEMLFVINESNRKHYRAIIPQEYFKEPVLTFDEILKEFEKMDFYFCKVEKKIAGVAGLEIKEEGLGQVRWVYVLPEYQRKGIGMALIRHIEDEAKKSGIKRLIIMATEKAYWAKNFYLRLEYRMGDKIQRPWGCDVVFEKTLYRR